MDSYIKDWFQVIKNGSVDNTYKMGWGRSIIECCVENPNESVISFDRLSVKMFKYYWNQTVFFDLQQSPNPVKPPELYSYVKSIISDYQKVYGYKPEVYDRIEDRITLDINRINRILKNNVCYRFPIVSGKEYDLYDLNLKGLTIKVHKPILLKEFSDFLFELINYRWTQILEGFNSSPRISRKVRIIDMKEVKRKSLTKYRKYLDTQEKRCFVCDEVIEDDLSIDHVIPWSYMYSDDLWNLVYTHRGCNSTKSNRIVKEEEIEKLEHRNVLLMKTLSQLGIGDKHTEELQLSINKDFPRKFWIGFKG